MLSFIDDDIAKYAIAMERKLNSPELISYNTDYLGNPLLSKRELRLINSVLKKYSL